MRVAVHHEDTKGTKARRYRNGSFNPDNIKLVVVAPLPDPVRDPSGLRALRAFVVNRHPDTGNGHRWPPIRDASAPSVPSVPLWSKERTARHEGGPFEREW